MTIFRKKEDRHYDADEVKQAVGREESSSDSLNRNPGYDVYRENEIPESAPLFVKIEKYREILTSINELKRFVSGIKQLFLVMNELQGIQQSSINILRAHVQRLEKSIEWVDHSLLKPVGFEEPVHGETEVRQIEQSLSELQREILNLRRDLEKLS